MDKFKTGWVRAAVSGKTADGRDLPDQQLVEMASNYNAEIYTAYLWLEHERGFHPDSLFNSLGRVLAVKSEVIKSGALAGKTALYVQLEPSTALIDMVRAGKKLHLSLEVAPNFADMGQAYLVGLGVTDSPAALGTEAMKFSAQTAKRHHHLFSKPLEWSSDLIQWQPQAQPSPQYPTTVGLYAHQVQVSSYELSQLIEQVTTLTKKIERFDNTIDQYGKMEFTIDKPAGEHFGGGDPDGGYRFGAKDYSSIGY
jgi:hypothetical protein